MLCCDFLLVGLIGELVLSFVYCNEPENDLLASGNLFLFSVVYKLRNSCNIITTIILCLVDRKWHQAHSFYLMFYV